MKLAKLSILVFILLFSSSLVQAAQFARPDQDVAAGVWTVTPLWSKIDETVANDATGDRINSTLTDTVGVNISLSSISDPSLSTGHVLRVRYRKQGLGGTGGGCGGQQVSLELRLFQGTSKIVNTSYSNIDCNFAYANYTLTAAEADSITAYNNLTVMFRKISSPDLPRRVLQVSWSELEVPDVVQNPGMLFLRSNFLLFIRGNGIFNLRA